MLKQFKQNLKNLDFILQCWNVAYRACMGRCKHLDVALSIKKNIEMDRISSKNGLRKDS